MSTGTTTTTTRVVVLQSWSHTRCDSYSLSDSKYRDHIQFHCHSESDNDIDCYC